MELKNSAFGRVGMQLGRGSCRLGSGRRLAMRLLVLAGLLGGFQLVWGEDSSFSPLSTETAAEAPAPMASAGILQRCPSQLRS